MRTIRRYEPSDIDPKSLITGFVLTAGVIVAMSTHPKPGESSEDVMRRVTADVLNLASDMGVTIALAEAVPSDIPAMFREAFDQ